MFYVVLGLHLFLCVILIVLVLLQQGKGASAGAFMGGSSNTLFGSAGASTVLTKVTTGIAITFMLTSVVLVKMYSGYVSGARGAENGLAGSVMSGRQQAAAPAAALPAQQPKTAPSSAQADKPEAVPVAPIPVPAGGDKK